MKIRHTLLLTGLLFGQLAGAHAAGTRRAMTVAETQQRAASLAEILPICEKGLAAVAAGADPKAAILAAIKDAPADAQQTVLILCGFYIAGAASLAKHIQDSSPKLSGGTKI